MVSNPLLAFEHQVIRPLGRREGRRWLLAVSGGVDSMVMLEVLFRWSRWLGAELAVAHVHHGRGGPVKQTRFRDRAAKLVRARASELGLEFYSNSPEKLNLRSESELREYRLGWLRRWAREGKFTRVAFAHHRDDLLETRLLRLIRGTGPSGLVAMRRARGKTLRPLLDCSRLEILDYARARKLKWAEDPSNRLTDSLRNWVRLEWVPLLEKRSPGASGALARSLGNLSVEGLRPSPSICRKAMKNVTSSERERLVADYLRGLGLKNYGQSHVREILKRLETRQKNLSFQMLGVEFHITPDLLSATRV